MSLLYPTIVYIFLVPGIFGNPVYVIYLLMAYTFPLVDTLVRPLAEDRNESKKYDMLMFLLFLLAPFFLVIAYLENAFLVSVYLLWWNSIIVSYAGFVLYLAGGITSVVSRAQLGTYGTGTLVIQDGHELFTGGIYKHIRNPMYAGGLVAVIGFLLVFRTLMTLFIVALVYFLVFRGRILEEEKLLSQKFGDKFANYCKNTWRLIPGLY